MSWNSGWGFSAVRTWSEMSRVLLPSKMGQTRRHLVRWLGLELGLGLGLGLGLKLGLKRG